MLVIVGWILALRNSSQIIMFSIMSRYLEYKFCMVSRNNIFRIVKVIRISIYLMFELQKRVMMSMAFRLFMIVKVVRKILRLSGIWLFSNFIMAREKVIFVVMGIVQLARAFGLLLDSIKINVGKVIFLIVVNKGKMAFLGVFNFLMESFCLIFSLIRKKKSVMSLLLIQRMMGLISLKLVIFILSLYF